MQHQPSNENVYVSNGHSLRYDGDHYVCDSCANRYYDPNGPSELDWCVQ